MKGGPWEAGAIGTAVWSGPWLRDVLAAAGVDVEELLRQYRQYQQQQEQEVLQAAIAASSVTVLTGTEEDTNNSSSRETGQNTSDSTPALLGPTKGTADGSASHSSHSSSSSKKYISSGRDVIQHVWFKGYDNAGPDTHFLVSIPLLKALSEDGDVMLAIQMNGVPLPGQHGYPVRAVVPGHVGVRSCKWLKRIVLSSEEAPSHWQQTDYKMLPPNMDWQAKSNWGSVPAMQGMPVQSAILSPGPGDVVTPDPVTGCVEVSGYAWSGVGVGVVRVEVSADGGKSWVSGVLVNPGSRVQPAGRAWAWVFWRAQVPVVQGTAAAGTRMGQMINEGLGAGVRGEGVGSANDGGKLGLKGIDAPGDAAPRRSGDSAASDITSDTGDSSRTTGPRGSNIGGGAATTAEGLGHTAAADTTAGRNNAGAKEQRRQQEGEVVVLQCKAVDGNYNTQPSDMGSIWNIRGAGCNAWQTVQLSIAK